MELALTFSAASQSATATPLSFSNHAFLCSTKFNRKRNSSSIKALSSSSSVTGRRTLSSNWDTGKCLSSLPIPSPRVPKFADFGTNKMLLSQRTLFISSEIGDNVADRIVSHLLFLDAEDPTKDIKLFINSPGGSITSAMAIYDAIKFCKADVSTICFGIAASMGALLLLSGTKGKRFCMPNARVMIHQLHGIGGGSPLDGQISVKEINYHMLKVNKIISRSTGQPLEKVVKDTEYDYYMNAWEAKAYGIVDEVIDDGKPGLVAPLTDATPAPVYGASRYLTPDPCDGAPMDRVIPLERRYLQKNAISSEEDEDEEEYEDEDEDEDEDEEEEDEDEDEDEEEDEDDEEEDEEEEEENELIFRPGVKDPEPVIQFR